MQDSSKRAGSPGTLRGRRGRRVFQEAPFLHRGISDSSISLTTTPGSSSDDGSSAAASLNPRGTPHPPNTRPSGSTVGTTRYLGCGHLSETPSNCPYHRGRFLPGRPGVELAAPQLGLLDCPAGRHLRFGDHDPQGSGGRRPLEGLPEIRPRSCAQDTLSPYG